MNSALGLLPLSLHRAPSIGKRMPHVPTEAERLRAWHNAREPEAGNHYPWPWTRTPYGSQSAATQAPSHPGDPAGCLLFDGVMK